MFLVNWFSGVLSWLGMGNKKAKILFLGLDNAGKTTLLHMLKEKKVAQLEPTQHPHDEELTMGKIKFRCVRAQGAQCARTLGALRNEGARKQRQSARGRIYGCVRPRPTAMVPLRCCLLVCGPWGRLNERIQKRARAGAWVASVLMPASVAILQGARSGRPRRCARSVDRLFRSVRRRDLPARLQ